MKLNVKTESTPLTTHEGARAKRINPEQQLRRSVMACMLWEDQFYEDGISIAERIADGVAKVHPQIALNIAVEARKSMKLRHAPLWIARAMAKLPDHKPRVSEALYQIIDRADELGEFLSLYWLGGKQPLSAQVKKGLARAFNKFDAYQLAKYNRDADVKLRDVMFLTHPIPESFEQEKTWKALVDGTLESPDTWEVSLSAGKSKKETFERLMLENKLGALALLRNLRNMINADVDKNLIRTSLSKMNVVRVLPFRFISASRYAPFLEPELESALFKCVEGKNKLRGETTLLVDVSGSMSASLSGKSDMNRMDAACGIAMIARELCESVRIFSFSESNVEIPNRRGFALSDAIVNSQYHSGTYLGAAVEMANRLGGDRIIVITDEQAHDSVPNPVAKGYMINVASYENGVGYGQWTHIDGFSEAVLNYITEREKTME